MAQARCKGISNPGYINEFTKLNTRLRFRPIRCRHVRFAPPLNLPIPFSNFRLHSGRSVPVPVLFWMSYSTHESHCFYSRLNVRPFRLPLLWPLLTSATASDQLPLFVVPRNTVTDLPRYDALLSHFTCQIYLATMFRLSIGFECCSPLPRSPSLISASCSSGQWFAIDFLQTPRYRDALAELLVFSFVNSLMYPGFEIPLHRACAI